MNALTALRAPRVLGLGFFVVVAGCERPPAPPPDYEIVPSVELDKRWAGPGDPIELSYRFDVLPENRVIGRDYEVRVDFVDEVGEPVLSDHHMPPVPTSTWEPGATVQYSRTVFIPSTVPPGRTAVALSVRSEQGQLVALSDGGPRGVIVSEVAHLTVDQQPLGLPISYLDGWYDMETGEDSAISWRWSAADALATFPNPGMDAIVYLHAQANVAEDGDPAEISVRVGPALIDVARFRVANPGPFLRRIYVPFSLMGGQEAVELSVSTDKVIVPAADGTSTDGRRLGLRVFNLHAAPEPRRSGFRLDPTDSTDPTDPTDSTDSIDIGHPDRPYRGDYVFSDADDRFAADIPVWAHVLAPFIGRPDSHYLEVNVGEGRSFVWMTENVFTDPTSTLTAADPFADFSGTGGQTAKEIFRENVARTGESNRVTLHTEYSRLEMGDLPRGDFDVICVRAAREGNNMLEDAMLARRLVSPGGMIIFDDYDAPASPRIKLAIDTFMQLYGNEFSIVHRGYQLIIRRGERP